MHSSVLPVTRNLPSAHPREPLLPGFKRSPLSVWPLLFLLGLVVFIALSAWQIVGDDAATPPRSVTNGRITQIETIGGGLPNATQQQFVKYSFMAGDKLLTGNEIVQYRAVAPELGDEIRVSYDPASPRDNYRALPDSQLRGEQQMARIALIIAPVFVFLWLIFMFFMLSPATPRDWLAWRRARGLYRKGEITTGRVQFVRNAPGLGSNIQRPNSEIVATYKVDGVRLVATTRCNNAWLINQLAPEIEVVVAYDPLKPERAVILEPYAF